MKEHRCIIGLLHTVDYDELVTLSGLREHIKNTVEFNETISQFPQYDIFNLHRNMFSLKDYADKRKSTDLTPFDFCPYCGKPIDWKAIGQHDDKSI